MPEAAIPEPDGLAPSRTTVSEGDPPRMPGGPRIRGATAADAPRLAELREEFRTSLAPEVRPEAAFRIRCTQWMASRLSQPDRWRCWIAEADPNGAVGMVWIQFLEKLPNPVGEPELHAYLTSLYVRAAVRDHGLGSALLNAALAACRERGCESVFLWPTSRSRPLYLRFGFAERTGVLERRLWMEAERPT
jgi:GNAT superfamily N-acetyltransferase